MGRPSKNKHSLAQSNALFSNSTPLYTHIQFMLNMMPRFILDSPRTTFKMLAAPISLSQPIFLLILLSSLSSSQASKCLFYKSKASCERYTDTGACKWEPTNAVCLEGGKKLPIGAFGVALMPLDPESMPLVLKPGPSSSSGNVSLVNGTEVSLEVVAAPVTNTDSQPGEALEVKKKTLEHDPTEIYRRSLRQAPAPAREGESFCSLPPVTGRCRAYFQVWYWDQGAQRCKEFVWGGCGGNANRFTSEEECQDAAEEFCIT